MLARIAHFFIALFGLFFRPAPIPIDQAAVVQAAINSASAHDGVVALPPGLLTVTHGFVLSAPVQFVCAAGAEFAKGGPAGSSYDLFTITVPGVSFTHCILKGGWSTGAYGGSLLRIQAGNFQFINGDLLDPGGPAVITGNDAAPLSGVTFDHSVIQASGQGRSGSGGGMEIDYGTTNLSVTNSQIYDIAGHHSQDLVSVKDGNAQENIANIRFDHDQFICNSADFAVEAGNFIYNNALSYAVVLDGGRWAATPACSVAGGGGTGATCMPVMSGNAIASLTTTPGQKYNAGLPTFVFTGTPLSRPNIVPVLGPSISAVQNIWVTNSTIDVYRNTYGVLSFGQNTQGGGFEADTIDMHGYGCGPSTCVELANNSNGATVSNVTVLNCSPSTSATLYGACQITVNSSSDTVVTNNVVPSIAVETEGVIYPGAERNTIRGNQVAYLNVIANGSDGTNRGVWHTIISGNTLTYNPAISPYGMVLQNQRCPACNPHLTSENAVDVLTITGNQFIGPYKYAFALQNELTNTSICGEDYGAALQPMTMPMVPLIPCP